MRYLSVCSGIEAASVAWHPLGWTPAAFSEVDAFPSALLAHHYPSVPNLGDMTKFQEWPDACVCAARVDGKPERGERPAGQRRDVGGDVHPQYDRQTLSGDHRWRGHTCEHCGGTVVDVLVGGTPCQSFSVAGLRKGLDDPRGNLMLTYLAIARRYRPRWVVWENVPGVLSSNRGRDFGTFLGGLAECGYGFAYRVLDAQHFGLAQRRKRVFVVGCLGDWRRAAAVLFERESLQGHPAPRRETGKAAPTIPSRSTACGGLGTDFDCDGGLIADTLRQHPRPGSNSLGAMVAIPELLCVATGQAGADMGADMAPTLNCNHEAPYIAGHVTHSLRGEGFDASEDGTGRGTPLVPTIAPCLTRNYGKQPDSSDTNAGPMLIPVAHAFDARQSDVIQYGDQTGPLDTHRSSIGVMTLAIRGRADGAQLEVRDDGTANAVLTSSGGRGGIGVGAVAFSAKDYGADAGDIAPTLRAGGHTSSHANGGVMPAVATHMAVRRLTPRECERLQGFPDDYTLIPYGKPSKRKLDADFLKYQLRGNPKHLKRDDIDRIAADGPRYKALGNSFAVPVVRWIGQRIQMVEGITNGRS